MRTMHTMTRSALILAGLGVGMSLGCLSFSANPDHCSNLDGDATCASLYGNDRPFCSWGRAACESTPAGDGCVEARPIDACYSPCGGAALLEDAAGCIGATGSSTDDTAGSTESSTTVAGTADASESSTTGPVPCIEHADCDDPVAPFCDAVSGQCVTCAATEAPDGACAEVDPSAPLCVDGACVQCTAENAAVCDELRLLCDDEGHVCVPCAAHEECASGACELAVGQCFPQGIVVHVDGDGGADYMTVTAAVGDVSDGALAIIVVHEFDSGASYQGSVLVDGGKRLALLGAAGEDAIIQGIGANPGLHVTEEGTTVYVDRLEVSDAAVAGIVVDGAFAWVDHSRIVGNEGGGILAQNTAELTLRNCFVGGDISDQAAVSIQASVGQVLYTTIGAGFGDAVSLTCNGASTVEARNSLFVARTDNDEIQCTGVSIDHSAAEMDLGGTNTAVGTMATAWFTAYAGGDFHLMAGAPITIATTARWELGDPTTDIDGEARPQLDGAPDVAGADVP